MGIDKSSTKGARELGTIFPQLIQVWCFWCPKKPTGNQTPKKWMVQGGFWWFAELTLCLASFLRINVFVFFFIANLEPKWPLFWMEKGLVLGGLTFNNRVHWGSRKALLAIQYAPWYCKKYLHEWLQCMVKMQANSSIPMELLRTPKHPWVRHTGSFTRNHWRVSWFLRKVQPVFWDPIEASWESFRSTSGLGHESCQGWRCNNWFLHRRWMGEMLDVLFINHLSWFQGLFNF